MSFEIEYDRRIFVHGDGDPIYYLFIKQGDNNVRPRPKTWCLAEAGRREKMLRYIRKRADACRGGDLQTARGWTTPELYLKRYEGFMGKAAQLTIEALTDGLRIFSLDYTYLQAERLATLDAAERAMLEVVEAHFKKDTSAKRYFEYSLRPNSLSDFFLWVNNRWLAFQLHGAPLIYSHLNE